MGGPNKYYGFNQDQLLKIFNEVKSIFTSKDYKVIVIPSMRTPKEIIDLAIKELGSCGHVVKSVDKKAYLSSLALANSVVVTCDSTSMISEAATSGKAYICCTYENQKKITIDLKIFISYLKR